MKKSNLERMLELSESVFHNRSDLQQLEINENETKRLQEINRSIWHFVMK